MDNITSWYSNKGVWAHFWLCMSNINGYVKLCLSALKSKGKGFLPTLTLMQQSNAIHQMSSMLYICCRRWHNHYCPIPFPQRNRFPSQSRKNDSYPVVFFAYKNWPIVIMNPILPAPVDFVPCPDPVTWWTVKLTPWKKCEPLVCCRKSKYLQDYSHQKIYTIGHLFEC